MASLMDIYRRAVSEAPSPFEGGELFRYVTGIELPFVNPGRPVSHRMERELAALLDKRAEGYPLQYLLGEWEFYGLPFRVGPGVLIPRQDTEALVDTALALLKEDRETAPELLDLCSGSGCIAIALACHFPQARVTALEGSAEAYAYLTENIARNGVKVTPVLGDLREYTHPVPADMIVSNPPYIPEGELSALQTEVTHEPRVALNGGRDGLSFFRAIARRCRSQLRPGGVLLLEIGDGQWEQVREILDSFGLEGIREHRDLAGAVRVVEAIRPA